MKSQANEGGEGGKGGGGSGQRRETNGSRRRGADTNDPDGSEALKV